MFNQEFIFNNKINEDKSGLIYFVVFKFAILLQLNLSLQITSIKK